PCAGDFCTGQSICSENAPCFGGLCGCAQPKGQEGGSCCQCYCNDLCVNRQPCIDTPCPAGQLCLHTCCDALAGGPVCWDPCPGIQGRSGRKVRRGENGQLTGLGIM
ncbi:MAG TPA: hypothetical protein VGL18_04855, partial [Actinomycetota bacterium]